MISGKIKKNTLVLTTILSIYYCPSLFASPKPPPLPITESVLCTRYFLPDQKDKRFEACIIAENQLGTERLLQLGTLLLPIELQAGREFLTQAAMQGNREAMYALAQSYEVYSQGKPDTVMILQWYERAAKANHALAQARLGDIYFYGEYTPRNLKKAFYWYECAGNQGVPESQFAVGRCYERGEGVAQNYPLAFEWYMRAASNGYFLAFDKLGDIFYYTEFGRQDYEQAAMWYKKAALLGDPCAEFQIGAMFTSATGLKHNSKQGFYWLEQSALQDFTPAQSLYGRLLYTTNNKNNLGKARMWLQRAAHKGDPEASFTLGKMYRLGDGVPQNFRQAALYFQQAANGGNVQAQAMLGMFYHQGLGVPKNYVLAAKWYKKAGHHGSASAQFNLSTLYSQGRGVEQNDVKAYAWADLAADTGLESATQARMLIGNWLTENEFKRAQKLAASLVDKSLPDASHSIYCSPIIP